MSSFFYDSVDLMSEIIGAQSDTELLSAITLAARRCGFERILIGTQWLGSNGEMRFQVLSGYPSEWQKVHSQRGDISADPTINHYQTQDYALVWQQEFFEKTNSIELFEEAQNYGSKSGVSVPVHEAAGIKSMISFVRDKPIDADPREEHQLIRSAELISHIAHSAFKRMIIPQILEFLPKKLTLSEITALRWVANGKTSWEISRIMHIAEATVVFHLGNAMKKLDVVNRPQAIAAGFRLGILE